jgi:hypothetical protein
MKRAEYLNAIVKHNRCNKIPYDINALSAMTIKNLRGMSVSISKPKNKNVEVSIPQEP